MTIKNGPLSKQLVLYPPTQLSIDHDLSIWLEDEEEEDESYNTSYLDKGPFFIVMFPTRKIIYVSAVANQGLPNIRG